MEKKGKSENDKLFLVKLFTVSQCTLRGNAYGLDGFNKSRLILSKIEDG